AFVANLDLLVPPCYDVGYRCSTQAEAEGAGRQKEQISGTARLMPRKLGAAEGNAGLFSPLGARTVSAGQLLLQSVQQVFRSVSLFYICYILKGDGNEVSPAMFFTTAASIQQLVLLVHSHSQQCSLPPSLQPGRDHTPSLEKGSSQADHIAFIKTDPKASIQAYPKSSIQANFKSSTRADPKASILTDPKASIGASKSCIESSHKNSVQEDFYGTLETGLKAFAQADSNATIQTDSSIQGDPKATIQEGHKASIQVDPAECNEADLHIQTDPNASKQADHQASRQVTPNASAQAHMCLKYVCTDGHLFTWCPMQTEMENGKGGEGAHEREQGHASPSGQRSDRKRGRRGVKGKKTERRNQRVAPSLRTRSSREAKSVTTESTPASKAEKEGPVGIVPNCSGEPEQPKQDTCSPDRRNAAVLSPSYCAPLSSNEVDTDDVEDVGNENLERESAVPGASKRGRQRRADAPENPRAVNLRTEGRRRNRQQPVKDDVSQICSKRKRKATPKLILPCEFEGCWKIFSSRQYLNHHMKYQHFQQKTFACSHPSCGKSFNFKKHLKEHQKLHSDQKDYICEFCARAFRTSSNLSIHRRIHTGEKPLQCEVCGYTCRQKASLNWHMRKHDAESSYQFPCEICGRRFEKRDNVAAHRSKSHPEHLTHSMDTHGQKPAGQEGDPLHPTKSSLLVSSDAPEAELEHEHKAG
ncbi:hypothetical protein NFI96_027717, partial [Prochilodus magdalenae]